jgi:Zn-dependent peptidase ImmA (M78 family)
MKPFRQFLNESKNVRINDFINFVKDHLELTEMPHIMVIDNPDYSIQNRTFGSYDLNNDVIRVQTAQRHPMDVYRTLAHELVHYKQKCSGKEMNGDDGSEIENETNATAAVILRQYSHKIPNHGY